MRTFQLLLPLALLYSVIGSAETYQVYYLGG